VADAAIANRHVRAKLHCGDVAPYSNRYGGTPFRNYSKKLNTCFRAAFLCAPVSSQATTISVSPVKESMMPTMEELCAAIRQRDEANPEAARLRDRVVQLTMQKSLLLAIQYEGWLTQSMAAELMGVHRGTINRAVKANKLWTNGRTGRRCLINPLSLCGFHAHREEARSRRMSG